MQIVEPGQTVSVTVTIRDGVTGVVFDPTTITMKVKDPKGVLTSCVYGVSSAVSRSSTGVYVGQFSTTMQGRYWVRFETISTNTSGTVEGVRETFVTCAVSEFVS